MKRNSRKFTTAVGFIRTLILLLPFILFAFYLVTHTFSFTLDDSEFVVNSVTFSEMQQILLDCVSMFRFPAVANTLAGWLSSIGIGVFARQFIAEYVSYLVLVVICELMLDVLLALPCLIKKWLGGVMYD